MSCIKFLSSPSIRIGAIYLFATFSPACITSLTISCLFIEQLKAFLKFLFFKNRLVVLKKQENVPPMFDILKSFLLLSLGIRSCGIGERGVPIKSNFLFSNN